MYSKIYTGAISGIDSLIATVEVDVSTGMPTFEMVGLLNHEVREAKERVKVALKNTGIEIPPKRITVSISPADMRKEGAAYDLPVAVGMLVSLGHLLAERIQDTLIVGELGLDGTVKPVKGILPIVRKAKQEGHKRCIVPLENAKEGAIIKDIQVIGVRSLQETIDYLILQEKDKASFLVPAEYDNDTDTGEDSYDVDFADINGQETVKRAMEVAAAGFHHILMIGPPGAYNTARPDYGRKSGSIYDLQRGRAVGHAESSDYQKTFSFSTSYDLGTGTGRGRQDTQTGSDLLGASRCLVYG